MHETTAFFEKETKMMVVKVQGQEDFFASCNEMATTITKILKEKGECHPSDIAIKDFSQEVIKRHFPMAYALAQVELMEN